MTFIYVLILCSLLILCTGYTSEYYTAAVVEYATPFTPYLTADEVMITNANNYIEFMTNASMQQVDIIVFPESGLSHGNSWMLVEVPDPDKEIVPCDNSYSYHESLVLLSCASRNLSIYTVINLYEVFYNTSSNQTLTYNTDVVFDRHGTVITRYRKYNPYGEAVNKTVSPEYSMFKTDFDVVFGVFTCFDIEFEQPALVLARNYGINHFVFPNCWSSELPFLTAIQMQWGWSFSLKVVLLAAGCNDPEAGASGSGIYNGMGVSKYTQTNSLSSSMLISKLQIFYNDSNNVSGKDSNYAVDAIANKVSPIFQNTQVNKSAKLSDKNDTTLYMLRDYLEVYETKLLVDEDCLENYNFTFSNNSTVNITLTTETTLCQNDFCCDFEVKVVDSLSVTQPAATGRGDDYSPFFYRLAVFDGVRSYGGGVATGGVQVCGIISCLNLTLASCGLRADEDHSSPQYFIGNLYKVGTTFHRISITSSFFYNNTFIFPSVLVTGEKDEFGKVPAKHEVVLEKYEPYNYSITSGLKIHSTINNLVTAALYARQFDKDGEPRTQAIANCPKISYFAIILIVCRINILKYFN